MGVQGVILGQIRHRWSRAAGLAAVIAFATGSFVALTASSSVSRLEVRGKVDANYQGTYDVLVRPVNSRSVLEQGQGLVRPNYLSGQFGGISTSQWRQIQDVRGVAVAAPIAMVGYVLRTVSTVVDVTNVDVPGAPAMYAASVARVTDAGLTTIPDVASGYSYVTDDSVSAPAGPPGDSTSPYGVSVDTGTGAETVVCPSPTQPTAGAGAFDPSTRRTATCWSRSNGRDGVDQAGLPDGHVGVVVQRSFPFLLAAVDPTQEARLVGLDTSVLTGGQYLPQEKNPVQTNGLPGNIPVIVADTFGADDEDRITVRKLSTQATAAASSGLSLTAMNDLIDNAQGPIVATKNLTSAQAYAQLLQESVGEGSGVYIDSFYTTGPTRWRQQTNGTLQVQPIPRDDQVWRSAQRASGFTLAPSSADDTWFRALQAHVGGISSPGAPLQVVGAFDPTRLSVSRTTLNKVPLETYDVPHLLAAGSTSSSLLPPQGLVPTDNPAGYLQPPPIMLTNLASIGTFGNPSSWSNVSGGAPISAVRVRVAGVNGADPVSRERVRLVADGIRQVTGLDVDVTVGSSPTQETVAMPAGEHGRPALLLHEDWVKKGVATAVLTAIDRKSLILFTLVLIVSAGFVTNATSATVRQRRQELAILSCLGWGRGALARSILAELGLIGVTAGVVGAAAAYVLGRAFSTDVSATRAVLAVPAAALLALGAAAIPALRASRAFPADAVRPSVSAPRASRAVHSVPALARVGVRRVPGRSLTAAVTLAVGICALTLTLAVGIAFRGSVVGSLLGDAVAVQVRTIDIVAVVVTLLLSAAAVADVVYVGLRERGAELAALQAVGWSDRAIARLIAWETVYVSFTGVVAGGALGFAGATSFAHQLPGSLVLTTAAAMACGVALSLFLAVVPARQLIRRPAARLLAGQ